MIDCGGLGVGIVQFACISEQTSYSIGYVLILLLFLVTFFKLSQEPIKRRMGASLLVVTIVLALGSVQNILFPSHYFIGASVLLIGSAFLLFQKG